MNIFNKNRLPFLVFALVFSTINSLFFPALAIFKKEKGPELPGASRVSRKTASPSNPCEAALKNPEGYLTALVPISGKHATTVEKHPTFWFYIPFEASNELVMNLSVYKDGYSYISGKRPITKSRTFVPIPLNPNKIGLEDENQYYSWKLTVSCIENGRRSSRYTVRGSIIRVPKTTILESELQGANSDLERGQAYAKNGIWFEAITKLGYLLGQSGTNSALKEEWRELLNSDGVKLCDTPDEQQLNYCRLP